LNNAVIKNVVVTLVSLLFVVVTLILTFCPHPVDMHLEFFGGVLTLCPHPTLNFATGQPKFAF
jgi:hypothetical protein